MKTPPLTKTSLALAFATISSAHAQLVIPPWGAEAYAYVAENPFGSVASSPFNFAPGDGGAGSNSASTSISETRGSASGSVTLNTGSPIRTPLIRTFAQTGPAAAAAFGGATGVEAYIYQGAAPATFSVNVNLSGTVTNPATDFSRNQARVSIYLSQPELMLQGLPEEDPEPDLFFQPEFFFTTDRGSLVESGLSPVSDLQLFQGGITPDDDILSGTLTWTMNPGDTAYLWAQGSSNAYGPNATSDARNTLTLNFVNATGLTALSAIPEPATSLLGGLGFLMLMCRRR